MQTIGVTGKIFNMKIGQTSNQKDKVNFRLGVRKQFVTDADKQAGKTMTFMPIQIMGPTATFVSKYFKDGDMIALSDMEYRTFRTQNAPNEFDDAHSFNAGKAGFVGDASGSNNNGGQQQQRQQPQNNYQQPQNNSYQQQNNYQQPQNNGYNQGGGVATPPAPAAAPPANDTFAGGYVADDDLPF